MTRRIAALVTVLLSLGALAACSDDKGDGAAPDATDSVHGSDELTSYWEGPAAPLDALDTKAQPLPTELRGATADRCAQVAAELQAVGSPSELQDLGDRSPDPIVREALVDQQLSLESVFAACRGDAPVSLDIALNELEVSNAALELVLQEAGLR